jgi:hypothetical protein
MAKLKIRSVAERQQAGKSLRENCPRLSHGKVILGQGKRDVVALIKSSNEGRLENLIPIRHGGMLQSPFAYFRGTALIQAHDLKVYTGKRDKCSFLRRLSSDEFRRLRHARTKPRLRYQRFRRDLTRTL